MARRGFALVAAEVVHDRHIAARQRRDQQLLDVGLEPRAVDRTVEDEGGVDPVAAQGGQEGHGLPVALRDPVDQALAARAATMGADHVGLGPGLVDEDQAAGIKPRLVTFPALAFAGHVRPVLPGGVQVVFEGHAPWAKKSQTA